jgi:hypothetical protein
VGGGVDSCLPGVLFSESESEDNTCNTTHQCTGRRACCASTGYTTCVKHTHTAPLSASFPLHTPHTLTAPCQVLVVLR